MREEEQKINHLLVTSFENVGKMEERMLEASSNDLSIAEVHMLECVGQNPAGYSTISGIAQALDITLPTVTVAVKRLEKKGYVVKRRDEYDGRVQRVELTPRGRKMDAAHKYFHQNMVRSITRSMSETEVEQLVQALGKLNDFFERKQEELYQKKKGRNE